jgi:hypothetical protein
MEITGDSYLHHNITLPIAPDISRVIFLKAIMNADFPSANIRLLKFRTQVKSWW